MSRMSKRINQELSFEAALHRVDLKDSTPSEIKIKKLNKEQQAVIDSELKKTFERKRQEYKRNV